MPLSDFFKFLGSGERQIVDRIVGLLDTSIASSQHLLSLVQDLKDHNSDGVAGEYAEIYNLEQQAHNVRRSLVRTLCSGSFFGGIREDLLTLCGLIDSIAHASKHSAMIFHDIMLPPEVIDYFFQEDVCSFISTCIEAAQLLKEAINALEKNRDEILSLTEKVDQKEADADAIQHSIVQHLYKNEINTKSLDIIILKDFLHLADDIADDSEHASDVLQILVAKGYS